MLWRGMGWRCGGVWCGGVEGCGEGCVVEGYGTGNTKQDNPGLVPPQKNKNLIVVSLDGLEGMEIEFFEGGGIFSVLPAGDVCEVLVIAGAFTGGRLVFGSEVAPA